MPVLFRYGLHLTQVSQPLLFLLFALKGSQSRRRALQDSCTKPIGGGKDVARYDIARDPDRKNGRSR